MASTILTGSYPWLKCGLRYMNNSQILDPEDVELDKTV